MGAGEFYTFALYDCVRGHYGTYSDLDFPSPPRIRRRHKIAATPGHLGLRYQASVGVSRCEARRAEDGTLRPFAWAVELHGVDHHGGRMLLELEVSCLNDLPDWHQAIL